jgi:hypothetical protein
MVLLAYTCHPTKVNKSLCFVALGFFTTLLIHDSLVANKPTLNSTIPQCSKGPNPQKMLCSANKHPSIMPAMANLGTTV